jgi:hypothetical protein
MGDVLAWAAVAVVVVAALWAAGAIYYDACGGGWRGRAAAAAWLAAVAAALVLWEPLWRPLAALAVAEVLVVAWWLRLRPSHDRDWEPAVAVLPRVTRDGDAVTVHHVRDFDYPAPGEEVRRYDTRTYRLSHLAGLDVIFFNWGSRWMCHPVLVFDFGPDGRLCVSVEVRYRKGQPFAFVRSLFRQQELIVLAADERDVTLRRTLHPPRQAAHLYRLVAPPDEVRAVFLDYADSINALAATPRWYHGLCMNCTTSFYRLPSRRLRLDWRVIGNARLDRALYAAGRLDRSLPFEDLRRAAELTAVANAAPRDGFGDHIRRELERRRRDR